MTRPYSRMPRHIPPETHGEDTCPTHGVPVVDLYEVLERRHFPANADGRLDGHPIAEGHQLAAEAIFNKLVDAQIVPRSLSERKDPRPQRPEDGIGASPRQAAHG